MRETHPKGMQHSSKTKAHLVRDDSSTAFAAGTAHVAQKLAECIGQGNAFSKSLLLRDVVVIRRILGYLESLRLHI